MTQSEEIKSKDYIGVNEKLPLLKSLPLSFQHIFAMIGATILVPVLFKIDPATVLFLNGLGTLIYILITKGKIPAYLGSSFAFLAPVFLVIDKFNYQSALGGFICAGLIFVIVAILIKKIGVQWLRTLLPPASIGAIVAIIGLDLAPTAAKMAGFTSDKIDPVNVTIAVVTLITVVLGSVLFRGFYKIITVLIGVVAGYALSISWFVKIYLFFN